MKCMTHLVNIYSFKAIIDKKTYIVVQHWNGQLNHDFCSQLSHLDKQTTKTQQCLQQNINDHLFNLIPAFKNVSLGSIIPIHIFHAIK